ncbi:MAG TPA: hypothetical protein VFT39_22560 [Vicinamibacterales bacterium]|nr:hypothetical protein [Vicinamibacterales bacterium]
MRKHRTPGGAWKFVAPRRVLNASHQPDPRSKAFRASLALLDVGHILRSGLAIRDGLELVIS